MEFSIEFAAIGGNRHPSAADWDQQGSRLLAFGAGDCIALWDPLDLDSRGVRALLKGHTKVVNAIKFFPTGLSRATILLSGSADHTLRLWRADAISPEKYGLQKTLNEHQNSIACISVLPGSDVFATGASDGTVKIWNLVHDDDFNDIDAKVIQTIRLTPNYFPLSLALAKLDETALLLAAAGTKTSIQIYVSRDAHFSLAATLTGHEGWIRSLAFTRETDKQNSDLLLASASQDKYIRLWRVHEGEELPAVSNAINDPALGTLGKSLSNKAHRIKSTTAKYSVTFEALLLGHEDWIYTTSWRRREGKLHLLSTSEDNSLAIWESDPTSGVWICNARLGEISAQKGSTTATGSAGGFWIGLWSPDGDSVVSLGRTGSWRTWTFSLSEDMWCQNVAITGHVKEVKGLCWSRDGSYLLSTSSDQTTRLFAEWKRENKRTWHEFSRPQIHGYDLNCIDSIRESQFISGADEKLLRVFDEPKGVAGMLHGLCRIEASTTDALPDAANIPVLGLSNKAIQAVEDDLPVEVDEGENQKADDPASMVRKLTLDINHPPFEDHLARHLLWPESEKLYGHGYEISAVATSKDGGLVATACRASSIDHAVIRLYDTKEWLEIKPPLIAHSLTITALEFSHDDQYLLSVGRDRQWAVFERSTEFREQYRLVMSNPKGHTRMILDGTWAPKESKGSFATAGRDKLVKIWQISGSEALCKTSIPATSAVTAVSILERLVQSNACLILSYGAENGTIGICSISLPSLENHMTAIIDPLLAPSKTINQLAWRPHGHEQDTSRSNELAVASDDASVRLYEIRKFLPL